MANNNNNTTVQTVPRLTIVMPFFNNKELVAEMIDCIMSNDFENWELIAVDDGSDKETLDYLARYETERRIRIIHRDLQPKGAQTCRNIGLELANGEYIIFFDSDDYVTPTCLSTRIKEMESRKDLDFMVFPSGVYVENRFSFDFPNNIYGYDVQRDDLESFARRIPPFIVWSNIYRTESLKAHGIKWDTNLLSLQDSDFNIQSIISGMKYDYAKVKPDYGYRISYSTDTISQKICSEKHIKSHIYATDKFFKMFQNVYRHKYDKAILNGAYCLYNGIFSDGINREIALEFVNCVSKHNKWLGAMFKIQVHTTCLLENIISKKRARQIPMALFLSCYYMRKNRLNKKKLSLLKVMLGQQSF